MLKILSKFKRKGKRSKSEQVVYIIVFLIYLVFALSYVYTLFWCFISGLKTHTEIQLYPFALPTNPKFSNYISGIQMFSVKGRSFFVMLLNSIYFSVTGPFINLFTTCLLSYVCSFYKFRGSKIFYMVTMITMVLPLYGAGGAAFKLYHDTIPVYNTLLWPLTSLGGIGANFLYFNAYFENLSWTYGEAAQIDGAGHFMTLFKIMLPQTVPIFGALFVMAWIGAWNDYGTYLIYLPSFPNLSTGLFLFKQEIEMYGGRSDIYYAGCFIVMLVPIIIYSIFNKSILTNVSLGGIKE